MAVETFNKELTSSQKEFESLLNNDFKERTLQENSIVKATVTEITEKFVVVDAKSKMEGMIPIEEFKFDDELSKLKVGAKIEVWLDRTENAKGEIVISREKAKSMKAWEKMKKAFETKEEVTGYITGKVKGGFICRCDGLATFLPSSQISDRPLKNFDHLMNVPIKVIAVRLDNQRGNCAVSRRAVLEKNKINDTKEALKNLKVGDIIEDGKVKALTEWGAFIDINGIDSLCHVSDLSHGRVKKPSDLLNVGDTIKCRITKIDPETNRVSVSIKALSEDPYANLESKYEIGSVHKGIIVKLMEYGAFVRLDDSIEGLVHSSSVSWLSKNVNPTKVFTVGQEISVKIISVDVDSKRISLSYRETQPNPWNEIENQVGEIVEVTINSITEKAIFAEMENGCTGMLHYRELSFNEEDQDLKKFKKGEKIKVKIIEAKDQKLRFSIRSMEKDPLDWFKDNSKKEGSIITTKVFDVLKTGIKVSVDPEKKIIIMIKKKELDKNPESCRPEIYQKENSIDCMITELDLEKRKVSLSPKEAQIYEEKNLLQKFGVQSAKAGATLADIFGKALGKKTKKKEEDKKEEE